jgi:copper chaperone CopZ
VKYTVDVQGMHCNGCRGLVASSLEEANLAAVQVDLQKAVANFESDEPLPAVQARIEQVAAELSDYRFAGLREAR